MGLTRGLICQTQEIRKLGTFESLAEDTEALVKNKTSVDLISFVLHKVRISSGRVFTINKGSLSFSY
jgi:hypothetical protein